MAVRNFWLDAKVDGRSTDITGGPKSKHGGMFGSLYIRNNGEIETAFSFSCINTSTETSRTINKVVIQIPEVSEYIVNDDGSLTVLCRSVR